MMLTDSNITNLGGNVPYLIDLIEKSHEKEEKMLIPQEWMNQMGEIEKSTSVPLDDDKKEDS